MEFSDVMAVILQVEGGYVNDPSDPGGETKYGISKRAYPNIDIPNLTSNTASALYMRDYWTPLQCDKLPPKLRLSMMSFGVVAGVRTAIITLQSAVRAVPDGVLGPQTLAAIAQQDSQELLARFGAKQIVHYSTSPVASKYLDGWAYRSFLMVAKSA
jgi:lysozyme family protein